tara:strand:+ start:107 stop:349 length:243 start_codon:yes stop_codon:yes gene_type:complete
MTAEELISSMGYGWKYETTESSARLVAEHAIETMYSEEEADEFAIGFVEWIYRNDYSIQFYFQQDTMNELLEIYKKEKVL